MKPTPDHVTTGPHACGCFTCQRYHLARKKKWRKVERLDARHTRTAPLTRLERESSTLRVLQAPLTRQDLAAYNRLVLMARTEYLVFRRNTRGQFLCHRVVKSHTS